MMITSVAVLRGGMGSEHDISLKTGSNVLQHLTKNFSDTYKPKDIFIDKQGTWHVRGIPMSPDRALSGVDVVFNALHGEYGEDGTVQRLLERVHIPYTGSATYASSVAMNKTLTKNSLASAGFTVPFGITLSVSDSLEQDIVHAFRNFPQPSVIKPLSAGSSVGVTLARNFFEFERGIKTAFQYGSAVLIEEYIQGKEATAGIVDHLRDQQYYRLPPVEIIAPRDIGFFSYDVKYSPSTIEQCPGSFSMSEISKLQELAETAHTTLGLRHYSRSDFIVSPRGVYFLETNTLPGLTDQSLLPKSLAAVGVSVPEFIDHIIRLALKKG